MKHGGKKNALNSDIIKNSSDNGLNQQTKEMFGKFARFKTGGMSSKEYALRKSAEHTNFPTLTLDSSQEYAIVDNAIKQFLPRDTEAGIIKSKSIGNYVYQFECLGGKEYRIIGKKKIPDAVTGLLERNND